MPCMPQCIDGFAISNRPVSADQSRCDSAPFRPADHDEMRTPELARRKVVMMSAYFRHCKTKKLST